MGKWDRRYYARPTRRHYRDYDWSPPRDEPCPDPETEEWQDNVPMWEKKFCYLVGRMPWKKVLSTKNFMNCQSNVLSWDDSAGEEAFNNAKKRFWEEINGLPSETQLPNPDMYIDEINWNPYIDPELVREVDRTYFNPDDNYYLPSTSRSRGNNGCPQDSGNPWEHCSPLSNTGKNKATGWDTFDNSVNDTSKLSKNNDPWESRHTQGNGVVKDNAWGSAWNKSWDSKQNNLSDKSNKWRAESNAWRREGTGWQDYGSCSWTWNNNSGVSFRQSNPNNSHRTQEFGRHQESTGLDGRGNRWGQPRRNTSNWEGKDFGNAYQGKERHGTGNCRKREGPDHHAAKYRGPRIQGGDYQSPHNWIANNNKRVNVGRQ